tara:strand:- start:56 stop:289 length:234 start_codon:yes stop_codon:yes gene_type:complete
MIDVEMWAIKDTEKNTLVVTKWGRNTWKRKVNPDSVNIVGYKKYNWDSSKQPWVRTECSKYKMLKPIKVKVMEIVDD